MVGLFLITFLLHLRLNPAANIVGQESGGFLYSGQRILEGESLYSQVWDSHPPALHYLNALVMAVFGPTPWVMWWLEIAFITATALLFFLVFVRILPRGVSFWMALIFLGAAHDPNLLSDFNLPETFALLPQVGGIFLLLSYIESRQLQWIFRLGLALSLAFLFNPSSIILGVVALTLCVNMQPPVSRNRAAVYGLIGLSIMPILIMIVWALMGSFDDLWRALVVSNVVNLQSVLAVRSVYAGIRLVVTVHPMAPLFVISVGAIFVQIGRTWEKWRMARNRGDIRTHLLEKSGLPTRVQQLAAVVALSLPVELLLVNVSGQNHGHNYLILLPTLCLGSAVLIAEYLPTWQATNGWPSSRKVFAGIVSVLLIGWLLQTIQSQTPDRSWINRLLRREGWSIVAHPAVLDYVYENTEFEDSVLVWGPDVQINFLSGRRSPTRFHSPNIVIEMAPSFPDYLLEYIHSIRSAPPQVVLVKLNGNVIPDLFDLRQPLCSICSAEVLAELLEWREFMVEHYEFVQSIDGWDIFHRVDG